MTTSVFRKFIIAASSFAAVVGTPADGWTYSTHDLSYVFMDGSVSVHVGIIDTRPNPRGYVVCQDFAVIPGLS